MNPIGRRSVAIALLAAGLASTAAAGDPSPRPEQGPDPIGYSAGYEFGRALAELERRGRGVELEAVFRGVLDALTGAEPALDEAGRRAALAELAARGGPARGEVARTPAAGRLPGHFDDFAQLNALREGVVTLPSGVQIEVLEPGSGRRPGPTDAVAIRYEGSLADGAVFDSTDADGPVRLKLEEIAVPGLREALLGMDEGARWRVVIPSQRGFGATGRKFLRNRDLIYEIELVSIEPTP